MQKKIFPIALTIALIFTGVFSLFSLHNIQGNARVINYAGVVRGATQRLIKQELNQMPNDALIKQLDSILTELQTGQGEHQLTRMDSPQFQDIIAKMQSQWELLKEEIHLVRDGGETAKLFMDSEAYFELADQAVSAAEQYSEDSELMAEKGLLAINFAFVSAIFFLYFYNLKQVKRQQEIQKAEEENRKKEERLSRLAEDLQGPMNDISELIYVSDVENYNLLFINQAGRETFHVDSLEGKKCYRVLQGKDAPCDFCTTPYLKEGENYTWEITNAITNKHYILKDRLIEWDGRPARMEIAFDTTESEKEKMQLKFSMEADKMITDCVRILYQQNDLTAAVPQVLELLGSFLSASRAYIIYIRDEQMYNDYEWCAEGVISQKMLLQALPVNLLQRWISFFEQQGCVVIEDLEQIQASAPKEYQILKGQGTKSLVAAPLEQDGVLIGYLGVDNPPPNRLKSIAPLLQTLCYFLLLAQQHADGQKQLVHMSYFDKLTSFYNRNRFMEDTNALIQSTQAVGIVYLDINGLKDINDQHGHEFGDKILKESARRMKAVFSDADFYRIGGDEFVIICPGISKERFQSQLRDLKKKFQKDTDCQAAIGSQWIDKIDNINQLIASADAKMYEDKKAFYRKNPASRRYRHYNDELLHLSDAAIVKSKLAQNQFVVYFQPKISPGNRLIQGAEALIRYSPKPGTVTLPAQFLPLLEEFETIQLIDFFVFDFVCSRLNSWNERGKHLFPISVNFSGASLREPQLVEHLTEICSKYGVSPQYVEIEVTEKVNEGNDLDMKALCAKLHEAGFTVAIDDFGTESANVVLLSEVDFDVLKLDRSIMKHIAVNPKSRTIVEAIAEATRKLGVRMVAEGIETEEQFSVVSACGAELVQGYLFSKPIPAEEYEKRYLNE